MTRRTLLASVAALGACPIETTPLDFALLPDSAQAVARDLQLGPDLWAPYREHQQLTLAQRIAEGSAEHITYYVLQSRRFTQQPPLDPVKLAATNPTSLPATAQQRFADFAQATPKPTGTDARHQILLNLYRQLGWTPDASFLHTMRFLRERALGDKDALYQHRGLSADTIPAQTRTIHRTISLFHPHGRALLAGPGLDLTRREGFSDDTPLASYQVDTLLAAKLQVDCVDVRPEVLAYLKARGICTTEMDLTTHSAEGPYSFAIATNLLLYLDDRALFAAMAGLARSLAPGGLLLHNDARFATKAFGQVLGLPAIRFEPISLGRRQKVEQMDRAVIHRKL